MRRAQQVNLHRKKDAVEEGLDGFSVLELINHCANKFKTEGRPSGGIFTNTIETKKTMR